MGKIKAFFITIQLLSTICLFPSTLRWEKFYVVNFTDTDLIIKCKYFHDPAKGYRKQKISNIDVSIVNFLQKEVTIIKPRNNISIIGYRAIPNTSGDFYFYMYKLGEIVFFDKMKALICELSIQTIEGEHIVKDIDDLKNTPVRTFGDTSILAVYTSDEQLPEIREYFKGWNILW